MTAPSAGDQRHRFKEWFIQAALSLWTDAGYDKNNGGFFEALDFNGAPIKDAARRVRVQARQIYVFSRAASLDWHPQAEWLAADGFEYFLDLACPNGGERGCIHVLSPDGETADETRDLYDQAFLLLACAWRWRAAKDSRALILAERTHDFLNRELISDEHGWIESDLNHLPRRQNPHMHLFEAFMALFDATGEEKYLLEADKIFSLFKKYFFDSQKTILREFFSADLSPAPGNPGKQIEPGHMVEWVWLLNEYSQKRAVDVEDYCQHLFVSAREIGADPETGFLVDGLTVGDEPKGTRRLWPQTEYLKAASVFAAQGDINANKLIQELIDACFNSYLNQPVRGLWCDQFDATGEPCAANVPASILYHLLDAVLALQPDQRISA